MSPCFISHAAVRYVAAFAVFLRETQYVTRHTVAQEDLTILSLQYRFHCNLRDFCVKALYKDAICPCCLQKPELCPQVIATFCVPSECSKRQLDKSTA